MKNKNPTVDFTELARKLREIYPAGRKPRRIQSEALLWYSD